MEVIQVWFNVDADKVHTLCIPTLDIGSVIFLKDFSWSKCCSYWQNVSVYLTVLNGITVLI